MDEGDFIINISSDEKNLVDESVKISEEWLNELLESVDVELLEDLDDVVAVDELSTPAFMKKSTSLQKDSDEDCVILDGDPDKGESVVHSKSEAVDGCAKLLIV